MASFIDGVLSNSHLYAYENFLVRAEVEHAKSRIIDATNLGRRNVAWCYGYNDYDSYTSECVDLYESSFNMKTFLDRPSDIGMFSCGGLDSFLEGYLSERRPRIPPNHKLDYGYIQKTLEDELRKLGCKSVIVHIGPKSFTERRLKKKGLFNEIYEDVTHNVVMWMVSLSW